MKLLCIRILILLFIYISETYEQKQENKQNGNKVNSLAESPVKGGSYGQLNKALAGK